MKVKKKNSIYSQNINSLLLFINQIDQEYLLRIKYKNITPCMFNIKIN